MKNAVHQLIPQLNQPKSAIKYKTPTISVNQANQDGHLHNLSAMFCQPPFISF